MYRRRWLVRVGETRVKFTEKPWTRTVHDLDVRKKRTLRHRLKLEAQQAVRDWNNRK